jgi:hypothetical protein
VFLQNKRLNRREGSEEVRKQGERQFDASVGISFDSARPENPPGPETRPQKHEGCRTRLRHQTATAEYYSGRHLRTRRMDSEDFVGRDAAFGLNPEDFLRQKNEKRAREESADCGAMPSRKDRLE